MGENKEKLEKSVPIRKEIDNGKTITYKIKFIDSFRFMSRSLSSLVDNLPEGLHCDKCRDCKFCLDYMSVNSFLGALCVKKYIKETLVKN